MAHQALIFALMLALQTSVPIDRQGCSVDDVRAIEVDLTMLARGDDAALNEVVQKNTSGRSERCVLLRLERSALVGWFDARALAPKGGAPELLAPVRSALNELEQLKQDAPAIALDVEYAQTAVRAAVAAAQDERAEMALLLTHARDLSERLVAR